MRQLVGLLVALCLFSTQAQAAVEFFDLACETSTSETTGTIDLDGALEGFQTFGAGVASGATVPYTIRNGSQFETGWGTFTDASPNTLSRAAEWSTDGAGAELTLDGNSTVCIGLTASLLLGGQSWDFSVGTSGSVTTGDIELGDVSDTTITRDSAGRVDIESVAINRHTDSDTPPSSPKAGDTWWDWASGTYVAELCDADSCQPVEVGVGASTLPLTPGTMIWWTVSSTCPANTIPANGATLSRVTYSDLWAQVAAVATNSTASDADWDDGNGTTTFEPPDLVTDDLFVRAGTVGTEQADSAPNITGYVDVRPFTTTLAATGPLTFGAGPSSLYASAGSGPATTNARITFNAQTADATYGAASEIRPANASFMPCIVY